jgi:hypothetical protein
MDTKMWLQDVHGVFYSNAQDDNERYRLYFDPRGWSSNDIKEFFEDLRYGDNVVYEKCLEKYPNRRQRSTNGLLKAQNRYMKWMNSRIQY